MTRKNKIQGLVAATFTPMHQDRTVNFKAIPSLLDFLVSQNIEYIYICGSTGEGPSLTIEERMLLSEAFKHHSANRLKIIVNVAHNSIFEAKKLAAHSQELNVHAISATVPSYYEINSIEALIMSMSEVASAAPETPFFYYHIPHLTRMNISMVEFLKVGSKAIPNLSGIKYTASTLHEYMSCVNFENGKYDILFGSDELLLGAMAMGAKGFIGSTYNFAGFIYNEVIKNFNEGNVEKARFYQDSAVRLIDIIAANNGLPAQKAMMKIIGLDCGPVRSPLLQPDLRIIDAIRDKMEEVGYFEVLKSRK